MKIFDCFSFFNEIELLELRLKILSPYVDYFVLVESNTTFRGDKKPFYFNPNDSIFQSYIHKIIYLKYENNPQITKPNDYSLEIQQRNYIIKGLKQSNTCQKNDIIIISDLDEIPNPDILRQLKTNSISAKNNVLKLHRIFRKRKNKFIAYSKYIQLLLNYYQNNSILDIMGGINRILKKVNSTVDENSNRNINKIYSEKYIKKCLKNGSLIYDYQNQDNHIFTKVSIESLKIPNIQEFINKYPNFYLE